MAELEVAVRLLRNTSRRGVVPHLLALGPAHPVTRLQRSRNARLQVGLADALRDRTGDPPAGGAFHEYQHLAWFELYRALREERLTAPAERVYALSEEMAELHERLTRPGGGVRYRYRYRWRTVGFAHLFENAALGTPRPDDVVQEVLRAEAAAAGPLHARECEALFRLNAAARRGAGEVRDAVEAVLALPGVLLRDKSLLTAAAAAAVVTVARDATPGLTAHLNRQLRLAGAGRAPTPDGEAFPRMAFVDRPGFAVPPAEVGDAGTAAGAAPTAEGSIPYASPTQALDDEILALLRRAGPEGISALRLADTIAAAVARNPALGRRLDAGDDLHRNKVQRIFTSLAARGLAFHNGLQNKGSAWVHTCYRQAAGQ